MMLTLTGCVVVMALVIAVTASAAHEAVFPPDAAASLGAVDAAGATVSDVVAAGAVVGAAVAAVVADPLAPPQAASSVAGAVTRTAVAARRGARWTTAEAGIECPLRSMKRPPRVVPSSELVPDHPISDGDAAT